MTLRPSNAYRWSNCAGSHALQQVFPDDEESPAAREGTAGHYWVTEALDMRVHPIGHLAPNGHPIDAEMMENGQYLLDDVFTALGEASPKAHLRIEQLGTAHGLIHEECEGTPDVSLADPVNHRIIVWDYKYGHRDVDPFRNAQLLCYLAAIIEGYELDFYDVKGWDIRLRVVQPRNFRAAPVREWKLLGAEAWRNIEALSAAASRAVAPDATCVTGPWCRDCTAIHACEAATRVGASLVDLSGANTPAEMTDAQLGNYLRFLTAASKRLDALKDAVEEVALSKIRTGARVPHWTIGHGDAREKWTSAPADVFALGDLMGVDLRKAQEPITPNQARKLLGVDHAVISGYAEKPRGAAKLVPVDETTAAKAFGQ